jgi:NTP pyrophosphatase (non-canonical NTP hydrolase)
MHIESILLLEKAVAINKKTRKQLDLKFIEEIGELAKAINKNEGIERIYEESVDCFIVFCQYYTCERLSKLFCAMQKNKAKIIKMSCEDLCFWFKNMLQVNHPSQESVFEVYNLLAAIGPFDKVFEQKVKKFYNQVVTKTYTSS